MTMLITLSDLVVLHFVASACHARHSALPPGNFSSQAASSGIRIEAGFTRPSHKLPVPVCLVPIVKFHCSSPTYGRRTRQSPVGLQDKTRQEASTKSSRDHKSPLFPSLRFIDSSTLSSSSYTQRLIYYTATHRSARNLALASPPRIAIKLDIA